MSYYINIIDTTSALTKLVVEQSSSSGIVLKWNGGDKKDELVLVTSEFSFDMLTKTAKDAAFINFFTGDEYRFKLQLKNSADDSILWQGYVLPDLYSEPYKNGCFFVSFTATDGLGRLKGKYLPDEFYSREKSLIDIYCQLLKLTGIELPLYFHPAIENFVNKDWDTIYIDTATFLDKEKKQDAFSILETLLRDTLCLCYQADNRWYIEGLNMRHIREVVYKVYDIEGLFIDTVNYTRLLKQITPSPVPTITMIPPYNEITVTHKKTEPSLPITLSKEVNDGWAIVTGVKGEIHASDWMANGGFYVSVKAPEYNCVVNNKSQIPGHYNNISYPQDDLQWVSLKEKIFYSKGQKVKFSFRFQIKRPGVTDNNPSDMNLWKDPFKYELVFNNIVIFSNFGGMVSDAEKLIFDASAEAKIEIEHIFLEEGLFDVKIYGPPGATNTNRIEGIIISEAKVSVIGFNDEEEITDVINGEFTIDKEVSLTYADDKSGVSKGFRLAKLKNETTFYNTIEVPILYAFTLSGKNYSVVELLGANLIDENKYTVSHGFNPVTVLNVFYNFNDGEQMVVETVVPYTTGSFAVEKYAVDDVVGSRNTWMQWTDAIYKIENTSYSKTVANIYRRLFNEAHEKLDVNALNSVKFNDIILFNYVYAKDFFVLNCSWNLDDNKTTLTLGRSHYKDTTATTPGDENTPPIVLAGDDVYITDTQTTASVIATAYDPDGYIASQVWTKIIGGFGDVIITPFDLATVLENLTEDYYTYQIQVMDNDGATAIDSLNIIRIKDYTVDLQLIYEYDDSGNSDRPEIVRRYKVLFSPNILPGFVVTLKGVIRLLLSVNGTHGVDGILSYSIIKNGAVIETLDIETTKNLTINYSATDEIFIELSTYAQSGALGSGDTATVYASVLINEVVIVSGQGNFIGLPVFKEQQVTV